MDVPLPNVIVGFAPVFALMIYYCYKKLKLEEVVGKQASALRSKERQINNLVRQVEELQAEIGMPPADSVIAKPLAATWHEERANWEKEVERLRECVVRADETIRQLRADALGRVEEFKCLSTSAIDSGVKVGELEAELKSLRANWERETKALKDELAQSRKDVAGQADMLASIAKLAAGTPIRPAPKKETHFNGMYWVEER